MLESRNDLVNKLSMRYAHNYRVTVFNARLKATLIIVEQRPRFLFADVVTLTDVYTVYRAAWNRVGIVFVMSQRRFDKNKRGTRYLYLRQRVYISFSFSQTVFLGAIQFRTARKYVFIIRTQLHATKKVANVTWILSVDSFLIKSVSKSGDSERWLQREISVFWI